MTAPKRIQAGDLMVGNLLLLEDGTRVEVHFLNEYDGEMYVNGYYYAESEGSYDCTLKFNCGHKMDSLRGIPISAELLERAGFEKSGTYWVKDKIYIYEWGITEITYHNQHIMQGDDERIIQVEFKAFHQLQVYYFALTGHKLTLNVEG